MALYLFACLHLPHEPKHSYLVRLLYSEQGHPVYSGPSDPNGTERPISQPPTLSAADQHHAHVRTYLR
jgi:hypothetical protein